MGLLSTVLEYDFDVSPIVLVEVTFADNLAIVGAVVETTGSTVGVGRILVSFGSRCRWNIASGILGSEYRQLRGHSPVGFTPGWASEHRFEQVSQ